MHEAGVTGAPACPRGLRHGFAVGTLQAGIPINLAQRWLGHARMSTKAIYAGACGTADQAFAARFRRARLCAQQARQSVPLQPTAPHKKSERDESWKLYVNAEVEAEA